MRAKPRILVVEDDPDVVVFLADSLEHIDFQILVARNGKEGLRKAIEEKPDLVVLDVMMPEMNGHEVCRRLKADSETRRIPILMLTAKGQVRDMVEGLDIGADDYMAKPYENAEFEARVKALLRRFISPRFASSQSGCILSILCNPGHQTGIRISGTAAFTGITHGVLNIDTDAYARHGENVPLLDWRFNSKQWGRQLYREIFVDHPEVLSNYKQALGEVRAEEELHLRFECSRDIPRIPLEFLFDEVGQTGGYLVLRHPLARSITDARVKRKPLSASFLNDLWVNGDELKILLIASNTIPDIQGVDQEIEALSSLLESMFEKRGISTRIETLPTEQAAYESVRKTLEKCSYHIVHYAGHGTYDRHSPEKTHLSFWEKENRQGIIKQMPISELQMLLRGSDVRFAYMSCCLGTTTGEPAKLLDDEYLGMADGIVHSGVPSVLGFRWTVSDTGAKTLALAFYESLARQGQIDTALLDARREVAGRDLDDITWLSPILIMQA